MFVRIFAVHPEYPLLRINYEYIPMELTSLTIYRGNFIGNINYEKRDYLS